MPALTNAHSFASEDTTPPPVRARDLGTAPGVLEPGPLNAITDVAGVRIGHRTIIEGEAIRTGVTAIVPHDGNIFREKLAAAVYTGNGFGKAVGFLQVRELGTLETPIVLTNTLSVAAGIEGVVRWSLAQPENERIASVNAVVGECNDSRLNDIRALAITPEHVIEAIDNAKAGPVEEGNVGGGTGMVCFGFKSGIGTSSRTLPTELGGWTVGVLVQANYGGVLSIDGHRVGEALEQYTFRAPLQRARSRSHANGEQGMIPRAASGPVDTFAHDAEEGEVAGDDRDGSCMIIIATDAPADARNLERMARRAIMGLARTGSFMSNGSGDFVIAFSTAQRIAPEPGAMTMSMRTVPNAQMSPLFLATVEATEEAVYNALIAARTMTGHAGRTVEAIDHDALRAILNADR